LDVVISSPPPGAQLVKQAPRLALRMHRAQDRLTAADIIVKFAADIQRIVVDEKNVIGFIHRRQGFALGQVALQLNHLAQLQERVAESRLLDMADETKNEARLHLWGQQLQCFNQRGWLGGGVDGADVRNDDFAVRPGRWYTRRADQPGGVESVRYEMEFALRLLRVAGENLATRGLGNCDNGGCVCNRRRFRVLRDLAGALTAAEEKADQIEGRRQPFITEVYDNGQVRKLLAQLLHQQDAGKWRHGDKNQVDLPLFYNATCGASQNRKPGHLRIGLKNFADDALE